MPRAKQEVPVIPPKATLTKKGDGRLTPNYRLGLSALLIANAVLALAYLGLFAAHLEQTSALFIGLPVALGLLIIHLSRAKSSYGAVLRGNLIFLCVVAPLLGEGSLCLIMAAPIFIAVSLVVVAANQKGGKSAAWVLALILPVVLGSFEREANLRGDGIEIVSSSQVRPGTVREWVARTSQAAIPAKTHSRFLGLGFPMPQSYVIDHGQATVQFSIAEGVKGPWQAKVVPLADGVRFEVLQDQSKLSHWVKFIDSEVHVSPAGPGQVLVQQSTRFQPLLHPLWYFVPSQRFAVSQMHQMTADTWAQAR